MLKLVAKETIKNAGGADLSDDDLSSLPHTTQKDGERADNSLGVVASCHHPKHKFLERNVSVLLLNI